jgi:geranylgeranyl diphosphate synthase type 3
MLAIRLMQLFSENKADFTKLTGILGLYFQIRDDYCNLCLQEVTSEVLFLDKWNCPCVQAPWQEAV